MAIVWDEVWLEMICQSNSDIAGSPRNILKYSPVNPEFIEGCNLTGGRALDGFGWRKLSNPIKLRIPVSVTGVRPIRLSGAVLRETAQTDS